MSGCPSLELLDGFSFSCVFGNCIECEKISFGNLCSKEEGDEKCLQILTGEIWKEQTSWNTRHRCHVQTYLFIIIKFSCLFGIKTRGYIIVHSEHFKFSYI